MRVLRRKARSLETAPGRAPAAGAPALVRTAGQREKIRAALAAGEVQTKLSVSAPRDACEQEADRVAEAVVHMPHPGNRGAAEALPATAPVQRMCDACQDEDLVSRKAASPEEEKEKERLREKKALEQKHRSEKKEELDQPKKAGEKEKEEESVQPKLESPSAAARAESAVPSAAIRSLTGRGEPLPGPVRAFFEPRFGRDFSAVRVHTGAEAAEAAETLGAHAFTHENHVAFAPGRYSPDTTEGRTLLAHELTHVVQQGHAEPAAGGPSRDPAGAKG